MQETRTFTEWEETLGFLVKDASPELLQQFMTRDQFEELAHPNGKIAPAVNHDYRKKFLMDNGYDVTRENMIDHTLSARPDFNKQTPSDGISVI